MNALKQFCTYFLLLGCRSPGGKPIRARESRSARAGPYDIRERGQRDTRPHSASQQPTPREAAARSAAARQAGVSGVSSPARLEDNNQLSAPPILI